MCAKNDVHLQRIDTEKWQIIKWALFLFPPVLGWSDVVALKPVFYRDLNLFFTQKPLWKISPFVCLITSKSPPFVSHRLKPKERQINDPRVGTWRFFGSTTTTSADQKELQETRCHFFVYFPGRQKQIIKRYIIYRWCSNIMDGIFAYMHMLCN